MVEMLRWILNHYRLAVGTVERVPHHVQPVTIAELRRLVPFVRRETHRLSSATAFDLDTPNPCDRIAITSLRISRADTSYIKSDFEVPDALTLESSCGLVGNY